MTVCRIEIEIVRAHENVVGIRSFEYSYAPWFEGPDGLINDFQQLWKRNVFEHMKRGDDREAVIRNSSQHGGNISLLRIQPHLTTGLDQIVVPIDPACQDIHFLQKFQPLPSAATHV